VTPLADRDTDPCSWECADLLELSRSLDGEEVTVSSDPPAEYVPGARCWTCRHLTRWYTTPAGVSG
jgi:hypothetical protein